MENRGGAHVRLGGSPQEFDQTTLERLVESMLGDRNRFFLEHWRQRPLCRPRIAGELVDRYGIEDYLRDLQTTQRTPYVAVTSRSGTRYFTEHGDVEAVRASVLEGAVSAMKASRTWHSACPTSWLWMRALFGALYRAVGMLYLSPQRSEDVDIFLAGPDSQLGTHFDTTDVFTLQLVGERHWTVDEHVDLDRILATTQSPGWYPAKEVPPLGPSREVTLQPGDALYVPAYCVHRVTGVSWSVSLSLGMRAPNEVDVVDHLLESLRLSRYASYPPVRTEPEDRGESHVEAKLELLHKVRAVLEQVEGAALATLLCPLQLPATFDAVQGANVVGDDGTGVCSSFRSGFALPQE